jgi:uncharacterized repeat protein (TIGR04138 family)
MPANEITRKTLEQVVHESGRYPIEAFEFVRQGLNHTVAQLHGERKTSDTDTRSYHVSGQQLCQGLRDYAVARYGVMAAAILHHWGITRTDDFGRIVFTMIDTKLMAKTDDDDIRDFHHVYDFATAFSAPARPIRTPRIIFEL